MSEQAALFDGVTIEPELDTARLTSQIGRVYAVMADGWWRTLNTISQQAHTLMADYPQCLADPPASISARLRDLRKPWWGAHQVERRRVTGGLWEYRLIPSPCGLLSGERSPLDRPGEVTCPMCHGEGRLRPVDYGQPPSEVVEPAASPPTEEEQTT